MMQALPRKRVLIINHENVTNCLYTGNQKNMLITNVLFRIGGACAMMSNRHANLPHVHVHTWCKLLRASRPPSFRWGVAVQSVHRAELSLKLSSDAGQAMPLSGHMKMRRRPAVCLQGAGAKGESH